MSPIRTGAKKPQILFNINAACPGELGSDDRGYETSRQHTVGNTGLEKGIFGIFFIDVSRVEIAGNPGKLIDI